jgi:type IV fimbrial biogenesis protein FimT
MPNRRIGHTLFELLMTLSLVAILLGIGIPSFSSMTARHRIGVEVDALFHAIHVARKESIMRRQVVSLCPSRDSSTCEPGKDWSNGWIMFNNRDQDSPPHRDPDEPLLQAHFVDDSVMIVTNRDTFTLRATQKRATNGTFIVCDMASRAAPKALVVSYTGRPRVAYRTPRGESYGCAD